MFLKVRGGGTENDRIRIVLIALFDHTFSSNLLSTVCEIVTYRRLKTKEYLKRLALKMLEVAYETCSLKVTPNIVIWL